MDVLLSLHEMACRAGRRPPDDPAKVHLPARAVRCLAAPSCGWCVWLIGMVQCRACIRCGGPVSAPESAWVNGELALGLLARMSEGAT